MAKYSVNTNKDIEKVIDRAADFFGEGLNMDITERRDCCIRFTGGGGHVFIYSEVSYGVREIIIESREWDERVEEFLVKL